MKIRIQKSILLFLLTGLGIISCNKEVAPEGFPLAVEYNINEEKLLQAFDKMEEVDGALSLVVCKDSVIVAEKYFNYRNSGKESLNSLMSITKSFVGVLTGIAIDMGFIESVHDPASKYLKDLVNFPDEVKENITLEQLLMMSTGHEWNGTGPGSLYMDWVNSENELQYILDLPLTTPPGTLFNYSDGASHLLSVIISQATGMNTADFARKYLFLPLGYQQFEWTRDSWNYPNGAAGLRLKPTDLVKFGQLILNKGKFNGTQIVSEGWIQSMTMARISTNNNVLFGPEYGYQIWVGSSAGNKYFMAMGWGGQFIIIVPGKRLVVTATCWQAGLGWQEAGEHWISIANIIMNDIVPSVQ